LRNEWKPTRKQAQFLSLPLTVKEGFYGGGAGSGKSDVLLMYGVCHKWHENPRFKQVFQRRTYPELKKEIVPRSKELYLHFGASFNKTDMAWTFPRPDQIGGSGMGNLGAMIFLGHCENEDDVHTYDSMEINLYSPDELTSYTEYIYTYIGFTRVRSPVGSGLPAIIRAAGMPGGSGHTFVKKRFVDPCPEGGKILVGKGGNKRIYIFATQADNQYIDPTYAQSLEGLTEAEKKAKKYGDWSAYLGQVFEEFRDKHYVDEPDNALHVVEPFAIPSFWPRIIVGDWGFRAQTYILGAAISPSQRVYLYREEAWKYTKIEEWAPFVRDWIDKDKPKRVIFCKSVGYEQGQEHTIQQQIEAALGTSIEFPNQAPGSRVAGKLLIHEYLRWKQKPIILKDTAAYSEEYAQRLLRMKGLEAYENYQKMFEPKVEEKNLPKLQIFKTCPLVIEALKACSYDKPKDNKPAEDVAEFDGDDPYDTLRYLVDAADSYFEQAIKEFEKIKEQQEITERLANTQDFTAFYRNMKRVESRSAIKPVSMFHRRRH
jgi:hypothetical protein